MKKKDFYAADPFTAPPPPKKTLVAYSAAYERLREFIGGVNIMYRPKLIRNENMLLAAFVVIWSTNQRDTSMLSTHTVAVHRGTSAYVPLCVTVN